MKKHSKRKEGKNRFKEGDKKVTFLVENKVYIKRNNSLETEKNI